MIAAFLILVYTGISGERTDVLAHVTGLVAGFGFVKGSTRATREEPAANLANDPYFSDGLRLVIALSPHPLPYHEVRSMRWEQAAAPTAEGQTESAERYVRPLE